MVVDLGLSSLSLKLLGGWLPPFGVGGWLPETSTPELLVLGRFFFKPGYDTVVGLEPPTLATT